MNRLAKVWIWVLRLAPGLLLFTLVLVSPVFRRSDGWLLPFGWALAVGAMAAMLFSASWSTRWRRSGSLLALALVGQACALQLIDAPPFSVYQRYFNWNIEEFSWEQILKSYRGLCLVGILIQTAIVFWSGRTVWNKWQQHIKRIVTMREGILLLLFSLFTAVLFSKSPLHYGFELALTGWISIVQALNLILVITAIPNRELRRFVGWLKRRFTFDPANSRHLLDRLLPWLVAGWVILFSGFISWSVFEGVPHIPDDVSYLFQAKYFSTGHLYLPAPPDTASFAISHVVNDGTKWFAYGFPGWPMVLALGVLAGVPWLVNPVLGGLTILLAHAVIRKLYTPSLAHAAVLLVAVSPAFLFTASSFMGHTITGVWVLLAILSIEKERTSSRGLWAALSGFCLGALFLTRPLEALLVGSVLGLRAIGLGAPRLSLRSLASMILAGIFVASLIFPYNYVLTGDATYGPHMKFTDEMWYPGADRLGFGSSVGNLGWPHYDPLPGHGPLDVIINANKNSYMTNFELFGWGFGSLLFVALAVLFRGLRRADWLFFAIVAAVVAGHSFYWSPGGPDFGARYWYQILIPLVVLTVRGVQILQQRLIDVGFPRLTTTRATAFIAVASLVSFINVIPWRSLTKYRHYRGMSAEVVRLEQAHGFGHSLVFLRPRDSEDYASAFIFNPPTLDLPGTIYALDAGPTHVETLRRRFPDRTVWFIGRFPSNEDPFRVLAGPFSPESQTQELRTKKDLKANRSTPSRQ